MDSRDRWAVCFSFMSLVICTGMFTLVILNKLAMDREEIKTVIMEACNNG